MSKLTKVVLYKHGVGYFERKAEVSGDAEVRLGFRSEEMNDVLKSLTVFDSGGGTVNSVSYDNHKPMARLLEEISLDVSANGGEAELLGAVRGASVLVTAGNRMITGQVVGVGCRKVSHGGNSVSDIPRLTIYDEGGALHSFDLTDVSSVRFLDEHLKTELKFLFDTLLSATKRDTKNFKLFARGEGDRELSISYVVECPVWKTSYRIALPISDEESPYLQGWALVDNPQDEDWNDVELSLVSGLPISFRHDLYSPRYLHRKEIEVERESSAGPVMTEGALFSEAAFGDSDMDDIFGGGGELQEVASAKPMLGRRAGLAPKRSQEMAQSQKVETVTQKVGQLFEYRIEHPVTVLRNQSALVPIVGGEFQGRRRLLYNVANRAENPFAIIDFKNTTGLTLEGGPVTIFEGDVYAGEAMMDTLGPDEERMLPYAVELGVDAKVEPKFEEKVTMMTLQKGIWNQKKASYQTTTYRFSNKSEKVRDLVLEHSISPGDLVRTPKPASDTQSFWRFEVRLEPKKTTEFSVTLRNEYESRVNLTTSSLEQVYVALSEQARRPEVEVFWQDLSEVLSRLTEVRDEIYRLQRKINEVSQGQTRIRENLAQLGQSHDEGRLRARYVGQLEAQEDEIAEWNTRLGELNEEDQERRKAVSERVAELKFEQVFEDE